MADNLVVLFQNSFRDALVTTSTVQLGESAQSISSSLDISVPTLLAYMISKGNSESGSKSLTEFINANDFISVNPISGHSSAGNLSFEKISEKGATALAFLAGHQTSTLIDAVAASAGLKTSSASSILKLVAPLLLSYFGQWIKEESMGISSIKDYLISQTDIASEGIPASLHQLKESLNPIPSGQNPSAFQQNGISSLSPTGMSKILPWLILLLTSLGLFYFLEKGCSHSSPVEKSSSIEMHDTL